MPEYALGSEFRETPPVPKDLSQSHLGPGRTRRWGMRELAKVQGQPSEKEDSRGLGGTEWLFDPRLSPVEQAVCGQDHAASCVPCPIFYQIRWLVTPESCVERSVETEMGVSFQSERLKHKM